MTAEKHAAALSDAQPITEEQWKRIISARAEPHERRRYHEENR